MNAATFAALVFGSFVVWAILASLLIEMVMPRDSQLRKGTGWVALVWVGWAAIILIVFSPAIKRMFGA